MVGVEGAGTGTAVKSTAQPSSRRLAVIGGGWAGLSAAIHATQAGWQVTLYESARTWGGRARTLATTATPASLDCSLDNGQHILIGAYRETLALMHFLGVNVEQHLLRRPLDLRYADGKGLVVPIWAQNWGSPWHVLTAILTSQGWSWRDRWALLKRSATWQRAGFACAADTTVASLCQGLPPRVVHELLEPLCLSALNTPIAQASGRVFLRVMQDALLGSGYGNWQSADLLLPMGDLADLLPRPATDWLTSHGAALRWGQRVQQLQPRVGDWLVNDEAFAAVVLACSAHEACRLLAGVQWPDAPQAEAAQAWVQCCQALPHEAIATVYVWAETPNALPATLPGAAAMLALHSNAQNPAQFVFDRGRLGGPAGLFAAVASACVGEKADIESRILAQLQQQLPIGHWHVLRTVVEKRATFACRADLPRPAMSPGAAGLVVAGDYVAGPYPGTLEGAVRSGRLAVEGLMHI